MNEFVVALPWRLASIAGLLVGIVSFANGVPDIWNAIERVGIAFAVFFFIGRFAQVMIVAGSRTLPPRPAPRKAKPARAVSPGAAIDDSSNL